jgi:hypothetical protein
MFARSHEDAVKILFTSAIFHLRIVDLGLPSATHEEALPGVELGIHLVQRAAARDQYPIPALLVISGRLGQARHLSSLADSLRRDFWHGEIVNKGLDEDEAIEHALRQAKAYCDVGIHVRDAGEKLCPTISPREDDLLRRCVLAQTLCVGVDLEWWGISKGYSFSMSPRDSSITKVLMGRFLLRDGKESSRPSFFKFESKDSANFSHQAVAVMVQKLSHIKLCFAMIALNRGILVTQQVGDSSTRPISLAELLSETPEKVLPSIPRIVSDVADQLSKLGSATEDCFAISGLIWRWHSLEKINLVYAELGREQNGAAPRLLEKLQVSRKELWVNRQTCTHGDLNASNIALEKFQDGYRAYIFDAGGIQADTAVRDLAMLEITLLLHQEISLPARGLVDECGALYSTGVGVPEAAPSSPSAMVENTFTLIREIRRRVLEKNQMQVYALMIFDCAMLQLGGLAIQSHGNKIMHPLDALRLAELTSKWLVSIIPELVA